jgi:hypothetical protein
MSQPHVPDPWKSFKLALAVLAVVLVVVLGGGFWWFVDTQFAVTPIRISAETTHLVEPLDERGRVDYGAALNAMLGQGVTPENNAVVLVVEAAWDEEIRQREPAFFERLGIADLPDKDERFVDLLEYQEQAGPAEPPTAEPGASSAEAGDGESSDQGDDPMDGYDRLCAARVRPWTAAQYPLIAAWLEANREPLDRLVEASRRPRWFAPFPENSPVGLGQHLSVSYLLRGPYRALTARVMLKAQRGDLAGACDDMIACRRLAGLAREEPTMSGLVVAHVIEGMSCYTQAALAHYFDLPAEGRKRLLELGDARPHWPSIAERYDTAERFMVLDATIRAVRDGECDGSKELEEIASRRGIDWNVVLKQLNAHFDELVTALQIEDAEVQQNALNAVEQKLARMCTDDGNAPVLLPGPGFRQARSEQAAADVCGLCVSPPSFARQSMIRLVIEAELADLALPLGAYRARHGQYPASLDALVPEFIEELPRDWFGTEPYRYRREGEGFFLYSIGPNGKDDHGLNDALTVANNELPEHADDYFLRVPPEVW